MTEQEGRAFQPTSDESERFVQVVSECVRIRRHVDLYRWLSGEVQHFLPHDILITAWGDFGSWDLKLDLASGLPGVRTAMLEHCRLDGLLRPAYARWVAASRKPVLFAPSETAAAVQGCACAVHGALRQMRGMLVHGVHDKRSGHDSLFIAFTSGSFTRGMSLQRFLGFLDPLVAQIDASFRKTPVLVLGDGHAASDGCKALDLSARELEVLESMCSGRTNLEIAAALAISPFTVKNHVQRIFRKIGVTNRTQAAARYAEALRQTAATRRTVAVGAIG
jgi:transcriptional regulator EpsA